MNKPLIVIAGASSGIGAAIARLFSSAGYSLGLISRNLQAMQELELPNAICLSAEVTDYDDLKNAIKTAENKFGVVDCLVNNAGYMQFGGFSELTHDSHERTVKINLLGVMNGIEAILPDMHKRKGGVASSSGAVISEVGRRPIQGKISFSSRLRFHRRAYMLYHEALRYE